MKRFTVFGLAAGLCFAWVAVAAAEDLAIKDGDTFSRGSIVIRVAGIDAPELHQFCTDSDGIDWPCGKAAKARLTMLLTNSPLRCRYNGHDKYNRVLAYCKAGGIDINAEMVNQGYATAYYTNDYFRQQAEAKDAKRGIWAGSYMVPSEWRKQHPRGK
jgi:endonuclease YncB( thermonuclease family)